MTKEISILRQDELERSTEAMDIQDLSEQTGYCMVGTRVGRN